ncbi:MAG: four helix bundle protein [Saprospiraceae bacterium]|nr:four helix bundle protein [Saprospiraceae bacterium]
MRDFRKLEVWEQSMQLANIIYEICDEFPKSELYGITQQMQRCAVSIPSNIAEGCSRASEREFSRFIQIALGSSFELEIQLFITKNRKYIGDQETVFELLGVVQKRLNALNNKLNSNN